MTPVVKAPLAGVNPNAPVGIPGALIVTESAEVFVTEAPEEVTVAGVATALVLPAVTVMYTVTGDALTGTVSVDEAAPPDVALKLAVAPVGSPLALNVTLELNPPDGVTVYGIGDDDVFVASVGAPLVGDSVNVPPPPPAATEKDPMLVHAIAL